MGSISLCYTCSVQRPVTIKGGNVPLLPAGAERSEGLFGIGIYWYAAVLSALFILLIGAGLMFGRIQVTGKTAQALPVEARYGTGSFKRHLPDGENCRYTVFDNKEGIAVEDRIARCDQFQPRNERRPTQFSWGK